MLSCLPLKIDLLSYAVLNIAAPFNNNTKLPSHQTCAHIRFWSGERYINVRIRFIWQLRAYALFALDFFLFEKLDYEKIDVRIQTSKHHKLNPTSKNVAVTFSVPKSIYEWPLRAYAKTYVSSYAENYRNLNLDLDVRLNSEYGSV